uniref:Uncharacterized protein n=1 Tax=Lotharella oceanica TaxID=641309 RepID=A0A7S2TKA6_9EUKA|mmetsp:Transcript_16582/g.31431  ORF Transcript_16582/g.31431 Transcript_16582/m.31431 type:complete len:247 (+) Transcript_16582:54-794(+)
MTMASRCRLEEDFFEDLQIIFWILKDTFWALLFPALSILFGIAATVLQVIFLRRQWDLLASRFDNAATLFWISGNFTWMIGETFYEPEDTDINLGNTPAIEPNIDEYNKFKYGAIAQFSLSVGVLLVFYLCYFRKAYADTPESVDRMLCFPTLKAYEDTHTIFWVFKDFFWALELGPLAVISALLTISIGVHVLVLRYRQSFREFWNALCLVLWITVTQTTTIDIFLVPQCSTWLIALGKCHVDDW